MLLEFSLLNYYVYIENNILNSRIIKYNLYGAQLEQNIKNYKNTKCF